MVAAYWQQPLLQFVRTGELPYWTVDTPHTVVLAGLEGDQAFLFDPATDSGPYAVPEGDLLLAWSAFDYAYAALTMPS
jgi:hypothetical protein